ncbi:MAG: cytochrome oxidase assembly protein, partial [Planctomycetes bacterium]|nr:cytochrome oxidase assembly protein [Planctomycetota bacterium]
MSRALHRFSVIVACFTLFVLLAGGNVTSRDAGMAFTDWWFLPLSQGSLFPEGWVEDVHKFAEHGHRLVGATLGLLTIALAVWLYRSDPRPAVRRLGGLAVGWVIVLGTLGGLRVLRDQRLIAIPHAAFAYLFLCLTTSIAVVTSPWWHAEAGGREAR